MTGFEIALPTRLVFGNGTLDRLGELAGQLGLRRTLLVADAGMVALGYAARATARLEAAGIAVEPFHAFDANPDTRMVEAGRRVAERTSVDSIVALGGGSSLDCAKGINFVVTNGGSMRDYRGHGKASKPMLPSIGIPTTAGTGSEAQSYALISDAETHVKMACGDSKAAFRIAILDPELTVSQPRRVSAIVGYDALSHAVESWVTTKRTAASDVFAREAWVHLSGAYARVLSHPDDLEARGAMLLGAHLAGIAIEQSMLGATHACANPLTARYGTTHGVAIAVMLPHVVRWNAAVVADRYAELLRAVGLDPTGAPGRVLADRLVELARIGDLPTTLSELGVAVSDLPELADAAAEQWTGTFNPRPFDRTAALGLYEAAY
jgi:alcohol dehydrogenase